MIDIHNCSEQERAGEETVFMTIGFNILRDIGVPDQAAVAIAMAMGQLMLAADRSYHTIVHVNDIFRLVGEKRLDLSHEEKVAIYFHDAIYVVGKTPESEIQSANLMKSMLSAYPVNRDVINKAETIILATAKHLENVPDNLCHRMLDLDIAGLATQPHEFQSRSALIEKEIGSGNRDKRAEFLRRFLSKSKLYYVFGDLESQARTNMKRELHSLG